MSAKYGALQGESLIHLRGKDIAGFLQGQLTADTRPLRPEQAVAGALCNAKGRVLADLRVIMVDETHCMLRLRAAIADNCATTLATYARFSRIECAADTGDYRVFGLWGQQAPALLESLQIPLPAGAGAVARNDKYLCLQGPQGMYELVVPAPLCEEIQSLLPEQSEAAESQWRAAELRAGLYRIDEPDVAQFTPQAVNLDLAGYVSFSKGCYTGQEVVARLHYRGRSKRRLGVFSAANVGDEPPRDASLVDTDGRRVGSVLRCESDESATLLIAASVQSDIAETEALRVDAPADLALTWLGLPYDTDT